MRNVQDFLKLDARGRLLTDSQDRGSGEEGEAQAMSREMLESRLLCLTDKDSGSKSAEDHDREGGVGKKRRTRAGSLQNEQRD